MFRVSVATLGALLCLAAHPVNAAEVAGVKVADQAQSGSTALVLNGAGLRKKFFFKVYVAALYVTAKTTNATQIIDSPQPRRIVMHMLRDLDADKLIEVLKEGLQKNHNEAELAALKADTDRFEAIMRGVGKAKEGDLIILDFGPDGTSVAFNGQPRGTVPGAAFGRALLKVWLGDKPADADLKQAMLGA